MGKFRNWIDEQGGPVKTAARLKVTREAVLFWLSRKGYPKVTTIVKIIKLSRNTLTFEDIVNDTKPKAVKGNA